MAEETTETTPTEDNTITIEDFMNVELRAGKILTCEKLPKSRKLLLMTVDLGDAEPRQILAGMAPWYLPEEMIGRRVAVVANLKPAKLMGHLSQGMILAASPEGEGGVPREPVSTKHGMVLSQVRSVRCLLDHVGVLDPGRPRQGAAGLRRHDHQVPRGDRLRGGVRLAAGPGWRGRRRRGTRVLERADPGDGIDRESAV